MKPIVSESISKIRLPGFPLAVLILGLLNFGLMIPWLGFYWDDWPIIGAARLQEINLPLLLNFYSGERPFSAWTYLLTMPVLGTRPLVWHIFTLLARWLAVLAFWWILRLLWPEQRRQAAWIALVFMVYPVFTQQPVAVAFSQHWLTYGLFLVSMAAMLQAVRNPRHYWLWTGIALLAQVFHSQTMEYFWGLDLLRPLLLWLVIAAAQSGFRTRLQSVVKIWLPYLLVLVSSVAMRFLFFVNPSADPHRPDLVYALLSEPLTTLLRLAQIALQDMIYNLFGIWNQTLLPEDLDLNAPIYPLSLLLAGIVAIISFIYLKKLQPEGAKHARQTSWLKQALALGVLAALLGPLPAWLTERQVIFGMYSGRFALAGMFGFSILLVTLLEWLSTNLMPKITLLSILFGLAAGYHLRNAETYYQSTLKQNQFYWQLFWRAPYLEPGTAILSADELFIYVGRDPTSVALNLLYPQPKGITQVGYWFLELYYNIGEKRVPELSKGLTYNMDFRSFQFTGSSLDSLLVYYKGGSGRCLWVLSREDTDNPNIPELADLALSVSNLSRIQEHPLAEPYPSVELYGEEPAHGWCYYYQKADLARQYEKWQTIVQLGEQALQSGLRPSDANEWVPFIVGYALAEKWQEALQHTNSAVALDEKVLPRVCRIWQDILAQAQPPPEDLVKIVAGLSETGCPNP